MRTHRSIEKILANIDKAKYTVPDEFPYEQARGLFKDPDVDHDVEIAWNMQIDEEGIVGYLCGEKGFAEDRIRNGVKKLRGAKGRSTQGRLDGFFSVVKKEGGTSAGGSAAKKPKVEEKKGKGKGGGGKKGFYKGK